MDDPPVANTSRHLWIVGVAGLLWNSGSAYDYLMTNIRDAGYLEQMGVTPEVMQAIDAMPVWAMVAWALGVWGALAGSLLLLLRSRFAAPMFAVSLIGLAGSTIFQLGMALPGEMTTPGMIVMALAIWAVAVLLLIYAIRMRRAGALR
jgi:hypothetical protein